METAANGLTEATAVSMQEMRGELMQLSAGQEAQKKYFVKELVRVEQIAESAVEKMTGLQEQVDSVRQQTRDMHDSLAAMHKHSEELTSGLKYVMQGFRDLHFDLPTKMDDWLQVRLGHEGGRPSTIPGEDLQRQGNTGRQFPSAPPPIAPLPVTRIPEQQTAEPTTESDTDGGKHSSRLSSTELFTTYMNPQSSQDNLLLELERGQVGERSSNAEEPSSSAAGMEWGHGHLLEGNADEVVDEEIPMEVDQPEGVEENAGVDDSTEAQHLDAEGTGRQETEAGDVLVRQVAGDLEEGEIPSVAIIEESTEPILSFHHSAAADEGTNEDEPTVSCDPPIDEESNIAEDPARRHAASPDIAPMEPFAAPSPISPNIVRSNSVEPPAGLLAKDYRMSPPSSQLTIPSLTPQPARQLLAVPEPQTGPMTRS